MKAHLCEKRIGKADRDVKVSLAIGGAERYQVLRGAHSKGIPATGSSREPG